MPPSCLPLLFGSQNLRYKRLNDTQHWTIAAKNALAAGQTITVNPTGQSMTGLIASGETVTLNPCDTSQLTINDIVLVQIQGRRYTHIVLHMVKAIEDGKFLIGANNGRIDGWVYPNDIFGQAILV
ncbi:hypothetical protein CCAX7_53570 [Capsulimonas corticalis]|uniref:Uncharacterized protein n=1 Tax=Capsulimonas corticalis TaxID=2219043 RepID=A0A402CNR1_9BACT|nr:S24 family peptidase [Capsulimonas corticalis]BDI33306.1 hypothetical protein CCAX7_53570 [Capsulimonas corticalis]